MRWKILPALWPSNSRKNMSDKLTPYSVTQGKPYFDWNEFLSRDPKTITESELLAAHELACKWPTCACGNQCAAIPRYSDISVEHGNATLPGMPKDALLVDYGLVFPRTLESGYRCGDFSKAREVMARIEARSSQILHEMGLAKAEL